MANKRLLVFIYITIVIVAAFARLTWLNQIPPGVNRDEASIGYTAFSLLKTGKDEYGRPFPLSFESFGDWKLPLYVYISMPFVQFLGPTELAIRLPSALGGILAVSLVYFLVMRIFHSTSVALISMALLAISPWHVHLSRVESESNLSVLWTIIALLFFLKALKESNKYFIPAALFFALPYYTYHGNHITTSLLLAGLVIFFWKKIPKNKYSGMSIALFLTLVAFILSQTFHSADKTKFSGISIFGNPTVIHERIELPRNEHTDPQALTVRLIHNRITYTLKTIGEHYIKSFSPEFLFIRGGTNSAHNIQNMGNLYLFEAPLLLVGFLALISKRKDKNIQFMLWWLAISPLAASITKDAPHTNRMFAIFPLPPIIAALGIMSLIQSVRKTPFFLYLTISVIVLGYAINMSYYFDQYTSHFPRNEGSHWGNPYKELTRIMFQTEKREKHVVIEKPESSPYIYILLYSTYDPAVYQKEAVRYPPTADAFVHVRSFGRFEFRDIDWETDMGRSNTILVSQSKLVPDAIKTKAPNVYDIALPNGEAFLTVVET